MIKIISSLEAGEEFTFNDINMKKVNNPDANSAYAVDSSMNLYIFMSHQEVYMQEPTRNKTSEVLFTTNSNFSLLLQFKNEEKHVYHDRLIVESTAIKDERAVIEVKTNGKTLYYTSKYFLEASDWQIILALVEPYKQEIMIALKK